MKGNLRVNIQNDLGSSKVSVSDSTRRDPKPVLPGKQKTYVLSPSGPVSDLILTVEGRSVDSYRIGVPTGIEIAPFEDNGGGAALPPNSSSWKLSIKESGPFDPTDGNATDKNVTIGENEPVRQY